MMEKIKAAVTIDSIVSRSSKSSKSSSSSSYTMTTPVTTNTSGSSVGGSVTVPDTRIRTIRPSEYKAAAVCLAEAFATDEVAAYFFECPDTMGWSAERKWNLHLKLMEYIVYVHACFGLVQAIGNPTASTLTAAVKVASNDVITTNIDNAAGATTVTATTLSSSKGPADRLDGVKPPTLLAESFDAVALWQPPGATVPGQWLSNLRRISLWWLLQAQVHVQLSREGRERLFREFFPLLHDTKEAVLKERDPEAYYLVYLGTHSRARGKGLAKRLVNSITRKADSENRACYLESSNTVNLPLYRKLGFEICKTIDLERHSKKVSMDIMVREPIAGAFATVKQPAPVPASASASVGLPESVAATRTIVIEDTKAQTSSGTSDA